MDTRPKSRWAQIRDRAITSKADRQHFERTKRTVIAIRRMLQLIDAERERAGLTKADLAHRIGVSPASVRRLFTSPTSNPTLWTVVELFDALDLEMKVQPRGTPAIDDGDAEVEHPVIQALAHWVMATEAWEIVVFQRHQDDDPEESCPAEEFFWECPASVVRDLSGIVEAVAESPPPRFPGGGMWEAMHGRMRGFFEARPRGPDRRLYRLFCILEREAPGLDGPSIVVIGGLSKPAGTAFSVADYEIIRRLGDEYQRRSPRNVV